MKYVVLVSHGTFATGLHSVLDMMAGNGRKDILSTSLTNGMSVGTFTENVKEVVSIIKEDDEIILIADIIGGSPLTATLNVLSEKDLLKNTIAFGGANLPLALNAVLMKDNLDKDDLKSMLMSESKDSIQEFILDSCEYDDNI